MSARRKRRREQKERRHVTPQPRLPGSSAELWETRDTRRLAYSRRQVADALGISISTVDRRVVPALDTVKMPWGQRLIPVDELERLLAAHVEPARPAKQRRRAGRPVSLPDAVVDRIQLEYARGRSLGQIAQALTTEGVPTAHAGRRWWPSTVRSVLLRARR